MKDQSILEQQQIKKMIYLFILIPKRGEAVVQRPQAKGRRLKWVISEYLHIGISRYANIDDLISYTTAEILKPSITKVKQTDLFLSFVRYRMT